MSTGRLKHSRRCYRWLFVWLISQILLIIAILRQGRVPGNTGIVELMSAIVLGYGLFVDTRTRIWWDDRAVFWRDLEALSINYINIEIIIEELLSIDSVYHTVNYPPGKPFDSIVLSGPVEKIYISPSFHQRDDLENLLRYLYEKKREVFVDPQVIEFMEGGFTEWWRYR